MMTRPRFWKKVKGEGIVGMDGQDDEILGI